MTKPTEAEQSCIERLRVADFPLSEEWELPLDDLFSEYDELKQRIVELENPWISVKDRLPEFEQTVIGFCPVYGRTIRFYSRIASDIDAGHWDDVLTGLMGGLPPSHWMRLPQPPEQNSR